MAIYDSNLDRLPLLTSRERLKLVNLLFACESMSRKETRDLIVSELPESICRSMLRDYQHSKADIHCIVKACSSHPGGLRELIESVQDYEGYTRENNWQGTVQILAVNMYLQNILAQDPTLMKKMQVIKLEEIVSQMDLTVVDLEKIYYETVPADYLSIGFWQLPRALSNKALIRSIFNLLSEAPTLVGGIPLILRFAEKLALYTNQAQKELEHWVDIAGQALGVDADAIALLRHELIRPPQPPKKSLLPYLLITLEPDDTTNQCTFSVKAWLQYGEEEQVYLYASEDEKFYNPDTIQGLLDWLLEKVACDNNLDEETKTKLTIEFFLPCKYFDLEVDSWLIEDSTAPLGARNKVVIRSLERIEDLKNRPLWITKWKHLYNPSQQVHFETVHWIQEYAQCHDMKVYSNLINEHIVCLGLTLVPPPVADPCRKKGLFHTIFRTGTPIAFWPRHLPVDPEEVREIQQLIKSLLSSTDLISFPEAILSLRREAFKGDSDQHLGHSLVLLWENPNRLPHEYTVKLEQTNRKGANI